MKRMKDSVCCQKQMPIIPKSPEFASQTKNIQWKAGRLKRQAGVTGVAGGGGGRRGWTKSVTAVSWESLIIAVLDSTSGLVYFTCHVKRGYYRTNSELTI